jgi:5-methylcytosine-specific restriction endonuclease McrA
MSWGQGSTRQSRKTRDQVLERDNHQCRLKLICCTGSGTEAHHLHGLQGRARSDATNPDEMVATCRPCHRLITEQQRMAAWRLDHDRRQARKRLPTKPHPGE